MPQHSAICLDMTEYCLRFLNMPENTLINCSVYARVLNVPLYSYNNITIVINVTILTFLSAGFVHPGSLLPFYHFKHELEHKNNES